MDNTDNITFSKFSQKPTYVVTNENDQITKHIQNYTDVARENTEEKSGQPYHKFSNNLAYTVSSLSTSLDSYSTKPAFNQSLKQSDEPSQSAQTSCEQEEKCTRERLDSSASTTTITSEQSAFFQEGSKRVTLQTSRACKRTNQNNEAETPTAKVPKKQKKTTTSTQSAPLKLTTKTPKNNEKIESNGVKKVSLQPQKRQNRINQNERTPPAKKQKLNQQSEQTESLVVKPVSMNIKSEYKVIAKIFFDKSFDKLSQEGIAIIEELSQKAVKAVSKLSTEETEAVRTLLDVLKQRKIKINDKFYQLIAMVATASSAETDKGQNVFIKYCHNGTVFFTNLPPNSKKTSMLTSVLRYPVHVQDFAKRTQDEIKSLAEMKELSTILSMCYRKGLPSLKAVDKLLNWSRWYKPKPDGSFDMELFRAVASMCNRKGLPNLEAVKKLLNLPCWYQRKPDGSFDMELFRAVASMCHQKGLPNLEAVKELLNLPHWKKGPDDSFDMELFRAVASMCTKKGLPNLKAVKELLNWSRWYKPKPDGSFNRELFRAVATMCRQKGLPNLEAVKELLNWSLWKKGPDGSFDMELFRAVAAMCHLKGLPSLEAVEDLLNLPHWKKRSDGSFDMELFRAVATMCIQKGLPNLEAVKELLNLPHWKKGPDDSFDMELFRAVASMCTKKGLPNLEAVEQLLNLPHWKKGPDDSFDMELFHAVTSMCTEKGLPNLEAVKELLNWSLWKKRSDDSFDMELFRAVASMCTKKGLPNLEAVKELLNLPHWKKGPDDSFDMKLFRAVASMCIEKGLPNLEAVKELLNWSLWKKRSDGSFNIQLFRAVAAMCTRKGFPKKSEVEAVLNWLSNGTEPFKIQLLRTMTRLQAQRSLPNINQLKKCEKDLLVLFPFIPTPEDSDEEDLIEEDNSEHLYQIKEVALYLYTGHSSYSVNWKTVRNFCNKSVCDNNDAKLKILCSLLSSFGGAGVSYYLSHQEQQKELLNLAKLSAPLKLVISAMQQNIPSESRKEYIEFGKYLRNPPNFTDWKQLLLESQNLSDVPLLKNKDDKRSYLQALWNLAPGDRKIFFDPECARTILEIIPSPSFLREFGKKYSGEKLKQLLEACSGLKNDTITREGIKALFLALLTGQFCLYNYEEIPDYCLSGYTDDAQGVLISVSGKVKTSKELALYFIALIMLAVDDDSHCKFNDKELTITDVKEMTSRKVSHTFPVPMLEIHGDSIQISNWSKEVFRNFLECFDIPKRYHFTEKAWKEYDTPKLAACDQKKLTRLERFHEKRTNDTVTPPVTILALSELYNLLKLNKEIKPKVWPSFDRHKERLSPQILNKLFEIINSMNPEDLENHIPDSLKNYLLIKEKELQEQQDNTVCPEVNDRQPVRSVHQADKHPQLNPKVSGNSDTKETLLDRLVNDIKSTALGVSLTRQKNTLRNALIDTLKLDPLLLSVSYATFEYLKEMELYKAAISLLKDGPDLERSNSTLENQVRSEDNDGFDLEEFNLTLDQLEASSLFKNIDVSGLDEFNPISDEDELKTPPYQDTGVFDLEEFI